MSALVRLVIDKRWIADNIRLPDLTAAGRTDRTR
jgi:hypothetical protein